MANKPTKPSASYYEQLSERNDKYISKLEKYSEIIISLLAISFVANVVLFILVVSLWGK